MIPTVVELVEPVEVEHAEPEQGRVVFCATNLSHALCDTISAREEPARLLLNFCGHVYKRTINGT